MRSSKIISSYWIRFEPCLSISIIATPAAGLVCQLVIPRRQRHAFVQSSLIWRKKKRDGEIWRETNETVQSLQVDVCKDRGNF